MIDGRAIGILPASTWAWIATLASQALLRGGTIGVYDALGSASLVGVADVIGQAAARASSVLLFADGVGAAGRGLARVRVITCRCWDYWNIVEWQQFIIRSDKDNLSIFSIGFHNLQKSKLVYKQF